MIQKTWRKKLNRRIGERVFLEAHKDFVTGNFQRKPMSQYLAQLIAGGVLLTPFLMIAAGIWIFTLDFPNILFIILGVVTVASGWMLIPPRTRNLEKTYNREELPALFGFFDTISDALGAVRIDGIRITDELNGYYYEVGTGQNKERIIGVGLILWDSLTPAQRISFAAHEVAHQVNADPARTRLYHMAMFTLEKWFLLLSPARLIKFEDSAAIGETLFEMAMAIPRFGIELIWVGMERLSFVSHQRAEYLADAMAAGISGVTPATELLEKLSLYPLLQKELRGLYPNGKQSGTDVMMQLAHSITDAPDVARDGILDTMRKEGISVDATHPPTAFRIAFLSLIEQDEPAVKPDQVDFSAIESELAPLREKIGVELLGGMEIQ